MGTWKTVRDMYMSSAAGKQGDSPPKGAVSKPAEPFTAKKVVPKSYAGMGIKAKYAIAPASMQCKDNKKNQYYCTRPKGHEGEHEAHWSDGSACTKPWTTEEN